MGIKHPCRVCNKNVTEKQKAVFCDICSFWVHIKCNYISNNEYEALKSDSSNWYCIKCLKDELPFSTTTNSELFEILNATGNNSLEFECLSKNNSLQKALETLESIDSINTVIPYCNTNEFNNLRINEKTTLGILHLNISSLASHIDDLKLLLSLINKKIHIICLSESRIKKGQLPTTNIQIPGYTFEHVPTESSAGGTLIYVSNDIQFKLRKDLNIYKARELESIFVELIFTKQTNLIIGCIYKHPIMNPDEFNKIHLDTFLHKTIHERKPIVIAGDFNFNLLNIHNHPGTANFVEQMFSSNFLPRILHPTRITSNSATVIDNIFLNTEEFETVSGNITASLSDHLPQFCFLKNFLEKLTNEEPVFKRDFRRFDKDKFAGDIEKLNWNEVFRSDETNLSTGFQFFLNNINTSLDEHAPIKQVSKKKAAKLKKPWISNEILKFIRNRDKMHKTFIKERNPTQKSKLWEEFKKYRNNLTEFIRDSKRNYYQTFFVQNKNNCKKTWQGINEIMNPRRSKVHKSVSILESNGKTIFDKKEIADKFNDFFVSIGTKTKAGLRPSRKRYSDFLNNQNENSFFINPTDPQEIEDIISQLQSSKATGPNSLPTNILKEIKKHISKPLCHLINISFESGEFPDIFKLAKIIPVFKSGSRVDVNNYRPISLLSNISKIIEKLMHSRLYKFLQQSKCFYQNQFGFRLKRSTSDALVCILDSLQSKMDKGEFSCGVFIDIKKAFDTVDHKILLSKLEHYGIRGIANLWFKSYLNERRQFVCIDSINSNIQQNNCGVPQGSILGPLLFILYINDLNKAINHSEVYHFADDTSLILSNQSFKELTKQMNRDLNLLSEWSRANELCLNVAKTELIIFNPPGKATNLKYKIKLDNTVIKLSSFVRYLGILLDNQLNWSSHISQLSMRLSRAIGILSKLRYNLPLNTLKMVYHSIFNSHILYGIQIWSQNSQTIRTKIQNFQNRAIRKITFSNSNCDMDSLYKDLKILKFSDLIYVQNCIFMSRVENDLMPENYKSKFSYRNEVHNHDTRAASRGLFNIPNVNTHRFGSLSTTYRCIHDWNNFLSSLDGNTLESLKTFQIRPMLSKTLLQSY